MAQIKLTMQSCGAEPPCQACGRSWERGNQMAAVVADDGEALGWICKACVDEWRMKGVRSIVAKRLMGTGRKAKRRIK